MSLNQKEFARLVAAYPSTVVDDATVELWMRRFAKHQPSVVARTVALLIDNSIDFPSVATFDQFAESERTKQKQARAAETRTNCDRCDNGWSLETVLSGNENHKGAETSVTFARPCSTCLPDTHARWVAGDYRARDSALYA